MICKLKKIINKSVDELRKEIREYNSQSPGERVEDDFQNPLAISILIPSLAFLFIFLPLTIYLSKVNGFEWLDILLFNNLPSDQITYAQTIFPFPDNGSPIEYPLFSSLLTAYGAIGLIASVFIFANSIFRLAITSNGIYIGYLSVYFSISYLYDFGIVKNEIGHLSLFSLKLIYIFLCFYFFEVLIDIFAKENYEGDKFRFLFPGLQGLSTGWLLEKEFGNHSTILNGILFMIFTFFAIYLIEKFVTYSKNFLMKQELFPEINSEFYRPKQFVFTNLPRELSKSYRTNKSFIIIGTAINAIFPFLVFIIWKLLLQGNLTI